MIGCGVGMLAGHSLLGILAFSVSGVVVQLAAPLLCLLALFVHRGLEGYLRESGEKRRVRAAFSLYLNPALVDQVLRHPELLRLGGEKKEVTVFFSDIEGFTALSEGMDPEELVTLLNRYLTAVTDIILEERGMLDKYEGDAVMAVFGAPLALPDHAVRACRAAVRIQARLAELETEPDFPRLRTRIGLNSGTVVAGNLGSAQRFDYTVMGDVVNLGSRLEGANKLYGSGILVSEATRERAGAGFLFRELDLIRVKGRQEPGRVFELRGVAGGEDPVERERLATFAAGLEAFRARQLDEAERLFRVVDDLPARLYLERIAQLRENPDAFPGDVFTLTSK
jgi:adenylate cyclase